MNRWSPANIQSILIDLGSTGAGGHDSGLLLASIAAFVAVTCVLPLLVQFFKVGGLSWRSRFVRDVGHRLSESFVFLDPRQLFVTQCVLMVVAALWFAWWLDMIWVGLVVSILVGFLPGLLLWFIHRAANRTLRVFTCSAQKAANANLSAKLHT